MVDNRQMREAVVIAWVGILQCEIDAAVTLLDEKYTDHTSDDAGNYILGRMGDHRIVVAWPSAGSYGIAPIVRVVMRIQEAFRNIQFCLLVGIAGGCPDHSVDDADIRLGDVVVSEPKGNRGGVVQIDMGKHTDSGFKIFSHLNKPYRGLLDAIPRLRIDHKVSQFLYPGQERDRLFISEYQHPSNNPDCTHCDKNKVQTRVLRETCKPRVFYGTIGSANNVLRSAKERDRLHQEQGILCVEMEAAGVMDTLSCLVIRGICDYADSHKNKDWQPYAAFAAAAYAKELLTYVARIPPRQVHGRHCLLGTVRTDDVDKALASRPGEFRRDLERLVGQMGNTRLHFLDQRMGYFKQFLQKFELRHESHWIQEGNHVYDGFNEQRARAVLSDQQKPPKERLRAARAYAFINANESMYASTFTVHDTVMKISDYADCC